MDTLAKQGANGRLGGTYVYRIIKYPDVFLRSVSNNVPFPLDDKTSRLKMDGKSYVPKQWSRFGCNTSWLSITYVCYGLFTQISRKYKVFINPEIVRNLMKHYRYEGCLSKVNEEK